MFEFFESIVNSISQLQIRDFIDIIIVAVIVYFIIKFTKHTRASQVLKGLAIIILIAFISGLFQLPTVNWLLNYVISAGALVIVIIFQPEIRRALEKIGRGKLFDLSFASQKGESGVLNPVDVLHKSILTLSMHKTGALIVFEQKTGLKEVIESGTTLNADISSELIENIFFVKAPLHDGAAIISDHKIVAAGCFLPLSDNKQLSTELGTRHRAALGISEISDAVVVVVSEETGVISCAKEGNLTRYIDSKLLRKILEDILLEKEVKSRKIIFKRKGAKNESSVD